MDGGSVHSDMQAALSETTGLPAVWDTSDDGPPRLWLAFLVILAFCAGTLIAIVLTMLPDRHAAATPPARQVASFAVPPQAVALRRDVVALTEQRNALEAERRRLNDALRATAAERDRLARDLGELTQAAVRSR